MPRFRSSSIQSEVVARWFLRAVTEPASCTAPPYNSSFSVNVVLPASGCEMMANVRRRFTSVSILIVSKLVVVLRDNLHRQRAREQKPWDCRGKTGKACED